MFHKGGGQNGESPELVAKTVFKAAIDHSSKLRYPVGKPAPLMLSLRKILPDRWYMALIRNIYKL